MRNKLLIVAFIIIIGLVGSVLGIKWKLDKVTKEKDVYKQNTAVLAGDLKRYKTKDSLNVVSTQSLLLTIDEFKEYRAEDFKKIESLKVDNKRLKGVLTAQTITITDLEADVRDSLRYSYRYIDEVTKVTIIDTLKCFSIVNEWKEFTGCIDQNNKFTGKDVNKERLMYVEHVEPKKFLFIKWGTKRVGQEILSLNPNTVVEKAEFVTIRK